MKAYIVDPFTQLVTATEYNGNFETISQHIGGSCRMFAAVRLYQTADTGETLYDHVDDHVYIDDEGLYVDDQYFWMHANYPMPLAGRGLILGGTPDGDSTNVSTKMATVMEDIRMIGNRFQLQMMLQFSKAYDMPSPDGYLEDYRPFVWKHHEAPQSMERNAS
jgi:hypothetical protein